MGSANAADFGHNRRVISRTVTKERPVFTTAAINDVIDGGRAQVQTLLDVPVLHLARIITNFQRERSGNLQG